MHFIMFIAKDIIKNELFDNIWQYYRIITTHFFKEIIKNTSQNIGFHCLFFFIIILFIFFFF